MGKHEGRGLMLADALQREEGREKKGKEEKRKFRTKCKTLQAQKYKKSNVKGPIAVLFKQGMDPVI